MDELSVYRSRIGLFVAVVCQKNMKISSINFLRHRNPARRPNLATNKDIKKSHETANIKVNQKGLIHQPNCHPRLLILLFCVSVVCWMEVWGPSFDISSASEHTVWNDYLLTSYHISYIAVYKEDMNEGYITFNETVSNRYSKLTDTNDKNRDEANDKSNSRIIFNGSVTYRYMELMDRHGQKRITHNVLRLKLEIKNNCSLSYLAVYEPTMCTYICVCRTCAYLLGNKGTYITKGNPRGRGTEGDPGEATITPEVLNLIGERVDISVGFIRVPHGHGTGFRVGQDMFMTAYHVLEKEIDNLLQEILFYSLEIDTEESVRALVSRLNVDIDSDTSEEMTSAVERALCKFIENSATDVPLLIQRLGDFTDTDDLSTHLTRKWNKNYTVDFIKHGKFSVDWRILFGDRNRDIVIVRLVESQTGQTFPRPLLLDENYRQHGNIHLVRYINQYQPKVVVDLATQVFQNDDDAQGSVDEAVEWWKNKMPDKDEAFFHSQYKECCTSVNEETGRVILRASESFIPGSSGSPVVYLFNRTGQPVVSMIYQKGYPRFYYEAQERFEDLNVDSKCFFEGGTTMKKVAELLTGYGKTDLKDGIFGQPAIPKEATDEHGDVAAAVEDIRSGVESLTQKVDMIAEHRNRLGQNTNAHTGKQTTDVMVKNVEKYEELDKNYYVTKAMESGKEKICSEHFLSITGVPGSGKTTTMWHIAIYLKNDLGFTVYPILHPMQFENYFNVSERQVFILDDVIGEYSVDNDRLCAWNKYNDFIKNCLSENTKLLTSIRIQLWEDQSLQGKIYVFNDTSHCINLCHAEFKLTQDEMRNMLKHYLEINSVDGIERLISDIWKYTTLSKEFVDMFPLLCKVFSQNSAVRKDPGMFFRDPFEAMTDIFTQIKTQNRHQFCGLVLCSALTLNDDYFSLYSEQELAEDKVQLRNVIMESLEVETKELKRVKAALESLDGVYVTRVGNAFQFSHSLFLNIVTYLYNDSAFVFKYGTWQFISNRVRINQKLERDNEYVLVYNSDRDIKRLADRFVEELKHNAQDGALFIVNYPCIDDGRLLSAFIPQLSISVGQDDMDPLCWCCVSARRRYRHPVTDPIKSVSQGDIDLLCWWCVDAVFKNRPWNDENADITTWRCYGLLSSLLQSGANCNTLELWGINGLHWSLYWNCSPLSKYLLQQPVTDINCTDKWGRCILHYAIRDFDIVCYLLNQPHLTTINHPDSKNRTPLWYLVHEKRPDPKNDRCNHWPAAEKERLIEMFERRGGIMLEVKEEDW